MGAQIKIRIHVYPDSINHVFETFEGMRKFIHELEGKECTLYFYKQIGDEEIQIGIAEAEKLLKEQQAP